MAKLISGVRDIAGNETLVFSNGLKFEVKKLSVVSYNVYIIRRNNRRKLLANAGSFNESRLVMRIHIDAYEEGFKVGKLLSKQR